MKRRPLILKAKFERGQRVRPSEYGIERNIFPEARRDQTGIVVRVDIYGMPSVLWDGRKSFTKYSADFITLDERPTP